MTQPQSGRGMLATLLIEREGLSDPDIACKDCKRELKIVLRLKVVRLCPGKLSFGAEKSGFCYFADFEPLFGSVPVFLKPLRIRFGYIEIFSSNQTIVIGHSHVTKKVFLADHHQVMPANITPVLFV